jgi:hypothetical protein
VRAGVPGRRPLGPQAFDDVFKILADRHAFVGRRSCRPSHSRAEMLARRARLRKVDAVISPAMALAVGALAGLSLDYVVGKRRARVPGRARSPYEHHLCLLI